MSHEIPRVHQGERITARHQNLIIDAVNDARGEKLIGGPRAVCVTPEEDIPAYSILGIKEETQHSTGEFPLTSALVKVGLAEEGEFLLFNEALPLKQGVKYTLAIRDIAIVRSSGSITVGKQCGPNEGVLSEENVGCIALGRATGNKVLVITFAVGGSDNPVLIDTLASTLTFNTQAKTVNDRWVCDPMMFPSRIYEAGQKVKIQKTEGQDAPYLVIHGDYYSKYGCFIQPEVTTRSEVVEGVTKYYIRFNTLSNYVGLNPTPRIVFNTNANWPTLPSTIYLGQEIQIPYPVKAEISINNWIGTQPIAGDSSQIKASPIKRQTLDAAKSLSIQPTIPPGHYSGDTELGLIIPGLDLTAHPEYKLYYRIGDSASSFIVEYTEAKPIQEYIATGTSIRLYVQLVFEEITYPILSAGDYTFTRV